MAELPGLFLEADIDRSNYGKIIRYINRALPTVNSASGALGAISIYKRLDRIFYDPKTTGTFSKKTGEIHGKH